jgi:hypothetical protein
MVRISRSDIFYTDVALFKNQKFSDAMIEVQEDAFSKLFLF